MRNYAQNDRSAAFAIINASRKEVDQSWSDPDRIIEERRDHPSCRCVYPSPQNDRQPGDDDMNGT